MDTGEMWRRAQYAESAKEIEALKSLVESLRDQNELMKAFILGNLDDFQNCPCVWCRHHKVSAEECCEAPTDAEMQDAKCPRFEK